MEDGEGTTETGVVGGVFRGFRGFRGYSIRGGWPTASGMTKSSSRQCGPLLAELREEPKVKPPAMPGALAGYEKVNC